MKDTLNREYLFFGYNGGFVIRDLNKIDREWFHIEKDNIHDIRAAEFTCCNRNPNRWFLAVMCC
jgi:hypothetical protein